MSLVRRRKRRKAGLLSWRPLVFTGMMGLGLPIVLPAPEAAGDPQKAPPANQPAAHPLDQPLQWLYEARKAHAGIRDYACTLVKQERVQGKLQEQNIILMKVRTNPFSVNMHWLAPGQIKGQEVSFIYGRNGNKMRVHFAKGIKKIVGPFVSIAADDPRVFQHSRHSIMEAGIGHLIEQSIQNLEMEKRFNKTQVAIAEYSYNNRRCYRIETTRMERNNQFYSYRSVLYLDKESKLPIRVENYDWPYQGGPAGGELLEVFSFIDVRFNVGLGDADFVR